MSDQLYIHKCPGCSISLEISIDTASEFVKVGLGDMPPLYRDKKAVIDAYKRVKKLKSDWEEKFKARAMIEAGRILDALGGPQLAVEAVEWVSATSRSKWDMTDVLDRLIEFKISKKAKEESLQRKRCQFMTPGYCREFELDGKGLCRDHMFCFLCRESLEDGDWIKVNGDAVCSRCRK